MKFLILKAAFLSRGEFAGKYTDGFSVTVGGNDEEDCMQRLIDLQEKHGDLTWYSGYEDQDYSAGEYIGRENFIYD